MIDRPKVLMVGPGRDVMGGISTVVNNYHETGLFKRVRSRYITSMEDGGKIKKLAVACKAYIDFCSCLKSFDIVHVHMAAQASFWRKAIFIKRAYAYGKKVIIHQHAADFDVFFKKADGVKKSRIKAVFMMAHKVIVLSEEWARFFGEYVCDREKICVIHNSVIMPDHTKEVYSDHDILFLGRLGARKGSYDLLRAVPQVLDAVPDVFVYLGGDGEVRQSRKMAEDIGISGHVRFLGWIRDEEKESYLKKCSIFVLPSYHEGMPMSVLEAMSYGLATVGTNAGGLPQVIENGVNGIRIDAGDIQALSESLIDLLQDEEKKKRIGQAAVKYISARFDARENVDRIYEIYAGLLEGDKG